MTASALSVIAYGAFVWLALVIAVVVLCVVVALAYRVYRRRNVTIKDHMMIKFEAQEMRRERGKS